MANEDERRLILDMIDSGKITAEEGLQLLQVLPEDGSDEVEASLDGAVSAETYAVENPDLSSNEALRVAVADQVAQADTRQGEDTSQGADGGEVLVGEVEPDSPPPDFDHWRRYWMIPLWIGVGIAVFGALLMFWAQQASGISVWFLCAGVPFTLGVILMALAWHSRTAHWLHLRVHQSGDSWPRVIAFSFPLPLGLVSWVMRTFGVRIPGMETTSIDELMTAIKTSTSPENPIFIEVEDEGDGELVQIYIG
jgi:hypothetical protein